MIPVLIQAGGAGTRLRPFTTVLPKPLMPIGDLPVIEIVLRQLKHYGFEEVYVSIGHLAPLLQAFLGDGSKWGLRISYVTEDRPLGTIGPFRRLPRQSTPTLVMNGDLLTTVDYAELCQYHASANAELTIGVYKCSVPVSLGVLDITDDDRITGFREKPSLDFWASMGVYVLSPSVWDLVPPDKHFGFDTLMEAVLTGNVRARVYRFDGIWLDIGRVEDYARAVEVFGEARALLLPDRADGRSP